MGWIEDIGKAIDYIENHMTEDITIDLIAEQVLISPFYFQRGFTMLCGFTVGEYMRRRRLSLAGSELVATDERIIDIALKYGYESSDSFTKAFIRFHGVTPSAVRKEGAMIKTFSPLKIKFYLEGGCTMDYKLVDKEAFTIVGLSRSFTHETAVLGIPEFWTEYYEQGNGEFVPGAYGVCMDDTTNLDSFNYMIADNYNPVEDVPEGFTKKIIPRHTWAVFACTGGMPESMQRMNKQIFSDWLPNCREYKIAANYNIEMYTPVENYPKGNQDENYYSEIWIPVVRK